MIYLLTGANSFEKEAFLNRLVADFAGAPERLDGAELGVADLLDILLGQTLFSSQRLLIIRGLSLNKPAWEWLGNHLTGIAGDTQLVLIENKPDKRSRTYKALQKVAQIKEFNVWSDYDSGKAVTWLTAFAKEKSVGLTAAQIRRIIERAGLDQWQLAQSIDKLSLHDKIDDQLIDDLVVANPAANVFELLATALSGYLNKLEQMIDDAELTQESYMTVGLLAGQAVQLAAIASAGPDDNVAQDFGVHPFVLSKLKPLAKKLGTTGAREVLVTMRQIDYRLKSSSVDPWLVLRQGLSELASKKPLA